MASARDRRPHLHSPQCNRTPSPSLLCPSSRRGWIKRVMITQSRSHGAGPSRVSAARVLLIWRRGRHLEPLSLFIFPGATSATGDARVQRLHTRAPLLSSCRSCETDAAIDPFSPLQGWQAGGKSRWMQACGALIGQQGRQELRVTWRRAWTGRETLPGDANAEMRHGGAWAFLVWANPSVGISLPFSLHRSLFSFLVLLFSALLRRPPPEPIWERRRLIT